MSFEKRDTLVDLTSEEAKQKRQHLRAKVSLLVAYRLSKSDGFWVNYAGDVSEGGLFIESDDKVELNERVELRISEQQNKSYVASNGRVAHIRRGGFGVHLDRLSEDEVTTLRGIVESSLRTVSNFQAAPS